MDQALTEEIVRLLKDGSEFVVTQAPDTIQQVLGYAIFSHSVGAIALSASTTMCLYLVKYFYRKALAAGRDSEPWWCGFAASLCVAFMLTPIAISELCTLIKILYFPKAYLLGLITNL